jgi:hypothetical protein
MDRPWDWGSNGLSSNPSITPEFIKEFIDKPWDWGKYGLSRNTLKSHKLFYQEIKLLESLYKIEEQLSFIQYQELESINSKLLNWLKKNNKNTNNYKLINNHFNKSLELLEYYSGVYLDNDMEYEYNIINK